MNYHTYESLTHEERSFFKNAITQDIKKYIILSIVWNLFMAIVALIFFPMVPTGEFPLIGAIFIGFLNLLGIGLIIDTIRKILFWRPQSFVFLHGEILETEYVRRREQIDFLRSTIKFENSQLRQDIKLGTEWQGVKPLMFAQHKTTPHYYVFNVQKRLWSEIMGHTLRTLIPDETI